MIGIILAAGQGSRLRPLTDNIPKCMVMFQGKPIINYAVEAMKTVGIDEIIVVTGYRSDAINLTDVDYVHNSNFANSNMVESLFCAKASLKGDIIVSYGDIVYGASSLKPLVECPHDFAVAVDLDWKDLWQKRMEDPLLDAETLRLGVSDEILEIGRKPESLEEIEAQYMGLFKISAEAIENVIQFYESLDRNRDYSGRPFNQMYMTDFIQHTIEHLMPVHAVKLHGGWTEIDTPADLNVNITNLYL